MSAGLHQVVPTPLGDVLLTCEVGGFEAQTASTHALRRGSETLTGAPHLTEVAA